MCIKKSKKNLLPLDPDMLLKYKSTAIATVAVATTAMRT